MGFVLFLLKLFYSAFSGKKKLAGKGFLLPQAAGRMDLVFKTAPCSSPATTSMLLKFQWLCMSQATWDRSKTNPCEIRFGAMPFFHSQHKERRPRVLYRILLSWRISSICIGICIGIGIGVIILDRFPKWINCSSNVALGARHTCSLEDFQGDVSLLLRTEKFWRRARRAQKFILEHMTARESNSLCTEIPFLKNKREGRKNSLNSHSETVKNDPSLGWIYSS